MSDLKPGEFVGSDGLVYGVIQAIRVFEMAHGGHSAGVLCIDHPDFPAAVAALQSLIQPRPTVPLAGVHPGVGLRWCDGSVDAVIYHFWIDADGLHWEEAGRVYERERG